MTSTNIVVFANRNMFSTHAQGELGNRADEAEGVHLFLGASSRSLSCLAYLEQFSLMWLAVQSMFGVSCAPKMLKTLSVKKRGDKRGFPDVHT